MRKTQIKKSSHILYHSFKLLHTKFRTMFIKGNPCLTLEKTKQNKRKKEGNLNNHLEEEHLSTSEKEDGLMRKRAKTPEG